MNSLFRSRKKVLIGVVHLLPLPGSPRWGGDMREVVDRAVEDARAYEGAGADALEIENFGDLPFAKSQVAAETIASMAVAGRMIRGAVGLPMGFNVLRNDARAALGLCAACGGCFIRVNVHVGAMLTDQGVLEGAAYDTLRVRQGLCPDTAIFADVHVKHGVPLAPWPLDVAARDTVRRGLADALIVTGPGTGEPASMDDLKCVRGACRRTPIIVGSGVTGSNIAGLLPLADGFIVGTSLKIGGNVENRVDPRRVRALRNAIDGRTACSAK